MGLRHNSNRYRDKGHKQRSNWTLFKLKKKPWNVEKLRQKCERSPENVFEPSKNINHHDIGMIAMGRDAMGWD